MKKRLKSLFKISVALITMGSLITIIGFIMGGAGELSKEVTELVHVIRISVSKTVERIPMLESLANINGFTFEVNKDEFSVVLNEEYETITGNYSDLKLAEASVVENLDISILSGKCTILPAENGYYGVESSGTEEFQCYVDESTLYLSVFPGDFRTEEDSEVTLYVPEDVYYEKVLLFCSADEMEIDAELTGDELKISSICGNNVFSETLLFDETLMTVGIGSLSVAGVKGESLKAEVSTADVKISGMDVETLEVNLGMGNLTIEGTTAGDMTLHCGVGHLEMFLTDAQDAYNYDISGSAESVQIGTDTLAGMVMERWIDHGSDKKITMSCSMGSIKIEFEQ